MEVEVMNLAECEFKDVTHKANDQAMQDVLDIVIRTNDSLKKEHCRIASFVNTKLKKVYYLAIWDGRIIQNEEEAILYCASWRGTLSLVVLRDVKLQVGSSMSDVIPGHEGDVM